MISEITRGWRSFERGQPRARQEIMMIEACRVCVQYVVHAKDDEKFYLDDEQNNWVLCIKVHRVDSLKYTTLRWCLWWSRCRRCS